MGGESVEDVRFFDFTGLYDGSWLLFVLVAAVSRSYGKNTFFKKMQVPTITGYMLIGFICGPYVLKVLTAGQVEELVYVNKVALSFIAFSAGAEIHWHEIAPLLKSILYISAGMTVFTMFIGTLFTFGLGSSDLLSWLGHLTPSCGISVSLLVATILSARSPTSVLAVVRELKAKGPVTDMMVAITVGGDIIVLTLFAINLGITRSMCAGEAFDGGAFFLDITLIGVAFIMGAIMGAFIILCLHVKHMIHLILPVGFIIYLTCDYILETSEITSEYPVAIDALLVCIAAGFVVTNCTEHDKREMLIEYLKKFAKYVFIPFFTVVGLSINFPVLIQTLPFSIIACIIRAICMQLGTVAGGHYAGLESNVKCMLWMGLIPQAGVSLGLAAIIAHEFAGTFGSAFQSTMIGIILINQIIGPIGAKYLLKKMGEDGQGEGQIANNRGMAFIGDFDKPKPQKETQISEEMLQEAETSDKEKTLLATARDINPPKTDEEMTMRFLDMIVENKVLPFYSAKTKTVVTAASHLTINPLQQSEEAPTADPDEVTITVTEVPMPIINSRVAPTTEISMPVHNPLYQCDDEDV